MASDRRKGGRTLAVRGVLELRLLKAVVEVRSRLANASPRRRPVALNCLDGALVVRHHALEHAGLSSNEGEGK